MKLVTSAMMRAAEERAVAAGVPLDVLMENAGLAVAQEAWLSLGIVEGRRVLVLAGPGNNGGDGLVAARHLADWEADVVVFAPRGRRKDDALLAPLRERNVPVVGSDEDADGSRLRDAMGNAELVIDALLGTGRSRAIEGAMAEPLRLLRDARAGARPPKVIAVDLPSGVDADSGHADALAVRADQTVVLGFAKAGLYTLPGSEYAGRIEIVDIGIPKSAEADLPLELLATAWVRERLPERPAGANKGTFGKVLVVAGSRQYIGAARLSAEAAYRAGAGLVAVACIPAVQMATASALPEATYVLLDDAPTLTDAGATQIIDALASYDVLLIGPGLSQAEGVREAVLRILEAAPEGIRACVIDADALNALAATPGWHERVTARCVLTPHPGEMARLTSSSTDDVHAGRLRVAMDAAAAWGQTVVLKGAHTIVAGEDGRAAVSPRANPLLAIGGTGDVLAGAIAGLIAQGAAPFEAAACAVYIGGVAAEEMREEYGDRGMLASELAAALPRAIRTIREGRRAAVAPPFSGFGQGLGQSLADTPGGGGGPA